MGVAAFARNRGEPTTEPVRRYSWPDVVDLGKQDGHSVLAVPNLRASHPCAQWVVLVAGELEGTARPTENPSHRAVSRVGG